MVTPVFAIPGVGIDAGKPFYVGLGIGMDSTGPDATWAHGGGTFGTSALACRMRNGWAWAVTFNSEPHEVLYTSDGGANFDSLLRQIFAADILESVSWPDVDLFPEYLPPARKSPSPRGGVNPLPRSPL